jgi:hypothetical protein
METFECVWYLCVQCTVNNTSDYTLRTLYRSYINDMSANIEMQVYMLLTVPCLLFDCDIKIILFRDLLITIKLKFVRVEIV